MLAAAAALAVLAVTGASPDAGHAPDVCDEPPDDRQFAVVVDAGSSGTRAHVYAWARGASADGIPLPRGVAVSKYPSLTAPGSNTSEIVGALLDGAAEAIAAAMGVLPEEAAEASQAPVWLLGTAGLRRIDKAARLALLRAAEELIVGRGFKCWGRCAQALSGEEEGVFMWLARNAERLSGGATAGVLEMGGESAQITFASGDGDVLAGLWPLHTPAGQLRLYTHSYNHFGLDGAEKLLQRQLLTEALRVGAPSELGVDYPCAPAGLAASVQNLVPNVNVTFVGSGDYDRCARAVRASFLARDPCFLRPCTFDGTYQPELPQRVEAFGAVRHYLPSQHMSIDSIRVLARAECSKPASAAGDDRYRQRACFAVSFIAEFLSGLGFDSAGSEQVVFPESWTSSWWRFGGMGEKLEESVTWCRGALIQNLMLRGPSIRPV
eukprot:TRINITY_DN29855_c0_g1_i1.p1 TRINITY_DN29855_c0_g1~~TRINITY_DN29855_c0_g1_i1.p1  ORF type:complete len:461 (+),score=172.92 TRINITY_DN29855_c0_g1_i1:75-1385(+)